MVEASGSLKLISNCAVANNETLNLTYLPQHVDVDQLS